MPTTIFSPVMTTAASTEVPAAVRFSVRIDPGEYTAGFPDMQELSLVGAECAKGIRYTQIPREIKPRSTQS